MKRLWILLLICGCGSSDPLGPPPDDGEIPFPHVRGLEMDAYLTDVARTFGAVGLMSLEFGSISTDWSQGFVSNYWAHQFLKNLLKRIELFQAQVRGIRPANEILLDIHMDYESALESFEEAFILFDGQVDFSTPEGIDRVNTALTEGVDQLDLFQVRLSDLVGTQIRFQ